MAYLVGISGGSASGKTTFINRLREAFSDSEITVLSQDNYYKPLHLQLKDENGEINYDEPESLDLDKFLKDLETLIAGNEIVIEEYTFNHPDKKPEKIIIKPAKIILLEGLFILGQDALSNKLDLKIFIDADEELKLNRRLKRDKEDRGMKEEDIHYQWHNQVVPSFNKYLLPHKENADIVVLNNEHFEEGFNLVKEKIELLVNPNS